MASQLPSAVTGFAAGSARQLTQPSLSNQQRLNLPASRDSTGSNNTYVMTASPQASRRRRQDPYMPSIITTVGQRPACLVNASVTYVGNDQIYAFGGFDQYTDEGGIASSHI